MVLFLMTEWLSEIFSDTKHEAWSIVRSIARAASMRLPIASCLINSSSPGCVVALSIATRDVWGTHTSGWSIAVNVLVHLPKITPLYGWKKWLKIYKKSHFYLLASKSNFVSCDLDVWIRDRPKLIAVAPWITCASLHQRQFIRCWRAILI